MNKERVAAFTDAIVAIAATIMVLELKAPATSGWEGLADNWSVFLSYLISFSLIYLSWQSHDDLFKRLSFLSRKTYLLNGIWVLLVTLVPFVTAWIGEFPNARIPVLTYILVIYFWSLSMTWLIKNTAKEGALAKTSDFVENFPRQYINGFIVIAIVLSIFMPILSLAWLVLFIVVSFYLLFKKGI